MAYEKKKHHYVSQLYLRHFTFDPEEERVYPMTKKGIIPDETNKISDICYEKNYNTKLQEDEQSTLENEYAKMLKDFILTPNPDDLNLSRDFIEFVSFMLGNNPYIREKLDEGFSKMELQIKDAPGDHDILMPKGHKGKFDWSIAFADAVFEEFHNWKFVRLETNSYKVFVTSDNPVSILNSEDVRNPAMANVTWRDPRVINFGGESIPTSDGWMSRETQVQITLESVSFGQDVVMIFPIAPNMCLIGFSDSDRYTRFLERSIMVINTKGFINFITFTYCNKAIYSHSKVLLKETSTDKHNFIEYCESNRRIPTFDFGIG